MKFRYKRTQADKDILFPGLKGVTMYKKPNLPEIEFTVDKVQYKATNVWILNSIAVLVIEFILDKVFEDGNVTEVQFIIPDGYDKDQLDLVTDIVTSLSWSARKKGKGGFYEGGVFLCDGATYEESKVIYKLEKHCVKAIHDYYESLNDKSEISYCDIVTALYKNAYGTAVDETVEGSELQLRKEERNA